MCVVFYSHCKDYWTVVCTFLSILLYGKTTESGPPPMATHSTASIMHRAGHLGRLFILRLMLLGHSCMETFQIWSGVRVFYFKMQNALKAWNGECVFFLLNGKLNS